MRPLQLKLKGINSYREEQVIDFETLTSQGLFGIFGPTGSGKSTILDAYPRLNMPSCPVIRKTLLIRTKQLPLSPFFFPSRQTEQESILQSVLSATTITHTLRLSAIRPAA